MSRSLQVLIIVSVLYGLLLPTASGRAEEPAVFPEVEIRVAADVPPFIRQACYAALRENGEQLRKTLWPYSLPPAPITVHLVTTREFQESMVGLPDWGVGAAWNNKVVIDCVRSLGIGRSVTHVLIHELAHCLVQQGTRMRSDVPRWFHEGVAQRVSGEWKFRDTISLLLGGRLPDLRKLKVDFPRSAEWADQAYRTSLIAVMALEKEYGPEVIPDIIRETALRGFDNGFLHVTGQLPDTFAMNFQSSLGLRYRWPLMLTRWPTMFVLLALLFLIGGAFKLIRSRRRLERMSDASPLWREPMINDFEPPIEDFEEPRH